MFNQQAKPKRCPEWLRCYFSQMGTVAKIKRPVLVGISLLCVISIGVSGARCVWRETHRCPPSEAWTVCVLEGEACHAGCLDVEFAPRGGILATVSDPSHNFLRVWDVERGELLHEFRAPGRWYSFGPVAFGPEAKLLAAPIAPTPPPGEKIPPFSATVRIWNLEDGAEICSLEGWTWPWIDTHPSVPHIAICDGDRANVEVWDMETCVLILEIPLAQPCVDVRFSPDGGALVVNLGYEALNLVDLKSGRVLWRTIGDFRGPMSFSPDGNFIVAGSSSGTIRVLKAGDGCEVLEFSGHASGVLDVAFHPKGRLFATTGRDLFLKLWSFPEGKELCTIDFLSLLGIEPTALVEKLARPFAVDFSPDGTYMASGMRTVRPGRSCPCAGVVHIWNISGLVSFPQEP